MPHLTRSTPGTAVGTSHGPHTARTPQGCGPCPDTPESDTHA
ncbi:hypothetical protein [Streptomyces nymphaeiformis]|uniref:Uncharacterized protein n=1 Tax=Streptomyces nymphaeiformis TaxID=2663842 RepID=A0A7W7U7R0_9ACTN|nr:hypothetical protein [Streptomyces nymphaeiformis]MBB4986618.1 hypothetical protein [Streptomyces nymphaeiformis]